jgi:uncharacterized protein YndB with AHSA1/START domain
MSANRIECEIQIEAPIEVVWRTISEPSLIEQWFSDGVDLDVRSGALGTFTFCPKDADQPVAAEVTVVDVDPPHLFSYRWDYPKGDRATPENSLLVTFSLTRLEEAKTLFRVTETGLEQLGWPDDQKESYAADHRKGWRFHSERLSTLDFSEVEASQ